MSQQTVSASVNRRTFLKAAGTGVMGAACWHLAPVKAFTLEEAMAAAREGGERVVPTFCSMCGPLNGCGVYAFVKDGVFTKVAGMKESPVNRGAVCPKGQAAPQWVYSPDRVKKPLKRIGAKGEGKFAEISWNEALDIVAGTLKKQKETYGPESLGMTSPARRNYSEFMARFMAAHGSPNYGHSGICFTQRIFAFNYTLGAMPIPDYRNADVVLVWGRQPVYSGPAQEGPREYLAAKKRGAKIVAIKPSVEPDVGMADTWVPIRPGTDAALGLGMLNVVINEGLIDAAFVKKWCYGYDQLKSHIQKYTPVWAARITGLPAEQIQSVARLYATCEKAAIDMGNGLEHAPSASDAIRCVALLVAITGHLDRPGGNIFPVPPKMPRANSVHLTGRFTQEWLDKLVGPEFPRAFQPFVEGTSSAYYRLFESVLTEKPFPIRTIIAPGSQAIVSTRGAKKVVEALKKLDFHVVLDTHRTADMPYADIVIPVLTPYEIDHPFEVRHNFLMARNRVIAPVGEGKSMQEFFMDLAVRMGYGADFWNGSMAACQNYQLAPFDMTIDQLRKHPTGIEYPPGDMVFEKYEKVFGNKSPRLSRAPYLPQGKVALYNTSFEAEGFSPLPEWREPPESITGTPGMTKTYPLILSDYHTSMNFSAGWQRNVPFLRELTPDPTLHIHPDTAASRGIKDRDWVVVTSPHGWLKVRAEFYPGIRPDTVMMLHGWWQGCKELGREDFPLCDGGANVNNMYSVDAEKAYDPLVTAMSSQTLVQVKKA